MSDLSVTVAQPDGAALSKSAASALELVEAFEVTDEPTYEIAADELKSIKAKAAALDDQRKAITRPLDEAKRAVMDLFRAPLATLERAEGILKGKLLGYQQVQAHKAAEARQEAERAAQVERDRLAAEAEQLRAEGRAGEAMVKTQVAQMIVATPLQGAPATPKVAGLATTKAIDFEVTDLLALVQHVAQRPELLALLSVDSVKLRAYVRGLGLACNLPGVAVFEKTGLSAARK